MEELERRLEHPSSEAWPLRGGPSPSGRGVVALVLPRPLYSPDCVE